MEALKMIGLLIIAAVLAVVALVLIKVAPTPPSLDQISDSITTFEECMAAGNIVMEMNPPRCKTPDGRVFIYEAPTNTPSLPNATRDCAVAGCSGQLCVSADQADSTVTTCEYRAEYACYKQAICEVQGNGQCGWTPTTELAQCLANPPTVGGAVDIQLEVM